MIYFCEDCGAKNILKHSPMKKGKAVFRCDACGYMNAYAFQMPGKKQSNKIDRFFKEIEPAPEIIGSFLFHRKQGILKNNMPDMLTESDLSGLAEKLMDTYLTGCSLYRDIHTLTLVIADKNMIVKLINPTLVLIIASRTLAVSKNVSDRIDFLVSTQTLQTGQSS